MCTCGTSALLRGILETLRRSRLGQCPGGGGALGSSIALKQGKRASGNREACTRRRAPRAEALNEHWLQRIASAGVCAPCPVRWCIMHGLWIGRQHNLKTDTPGPKKPVHCIFPLKEIWPQPLRRCRCDRSPPCDARCQSQSQASRELSSRCWELRVGSMVWGLSWGSDSASAQVHEALFEGLSG